MAFVVNKMAALCGLDFDGIDRNIYVTGTFYMHHNIKSTLCVYRLTSVYVFAELFTMLLTWLCLD